MFSKSLLHFARYRIPPAALYAIPLAIFIKDKMFSETWLLYLGNALFLFYIFIFGTFYSERPGYQTSSLNSGLAVTFDGIFLSCILVVISIVIFAPGLFGIGSSGHSLKNTPAALPDKHSHGIIFIIFASAIIGNFTAGSVSSILSAAATKRINAPDKS